MPCDCKAAPPSTAAREQEPDPTQRLLRRIQAWREDDKGGYDQAIALLCEAEELLSERASLRMCSVMNSRRCSPSGRAERSEVMIRRDVVKQYVVGALGYTEFRRQLTAWPYWESDDLFGVEGACCDIESGDCTEAELRAALLDWLLTPRLAPHESGTTGAVVVVATSYA